MPWPYVDQDVLAAADVNKIVPDAMAGVAYTPVLTATVTNPTAGTGNRRQGRYYRMGKLVYVAIFWQFGSSGMGAGSGAYRMSVPVNVAQAAIDNRLRCGTGRLVDISVPTSKLFVCYPVSATTVAFVSDAVAGEVGSGTPWVWAASDWFAGTFCYEAA